MRRLNGFTVFFCLVSVAVGSFVGIRGYEYICREDRFEIVGEREIGIAMYSPEFIYNDEGVSIVEFGRDISKAVVIETNMNDLGNGRYSVDTAVPGRYYMKYTVDSPKYKEVCRIRTFVVGGEE